MILPVAVAMFACFLATGNRRAALAWAVFVPATLLAVLLAKVAVAGCPAAFPPWMHLVSPSGHTASAALVYGALAGMLAKRVRSPWAAGAAVAGFAVLFGVSRLALGVHTPADVVAGGLIGGAGGLATFMLSGTGRGGPPLRHASLFLVVLLVTVVPLHGLHLDAEGTIRHLAAGSGPAGCFRD